MGEIKPVPIWPGGKATAPQPGQPTTPATTPSKPAAAPPSTKGAAAAFGIPHGGVAAPRAPAPASSSTSSSAATLTGHPRDPWGKPWPGSKPAQPTPAPAPAITGVAPDYPSFGPPVPLELGDYFVRGTDVWVLTPGGWRRENVDLFLNAIDELTLAARNTETETE